MVCSNCVQSKIRVDFLPLVLSLLNVARIPVVHKLELVQQGDVVIELPDGMQRTLQMQALKRR